MMQEKTDSQTEKPERPLTAAQKKAARREKERVRMAAKRASARAIQKVMLAEGAQLPVKTKVTLIKEIGKVGSTRRATHATPAPSVPLTIWQRIDRICRGPKGDEIAAKWVDMAVRGSFQHAAAIIDRQSGKVPDRHITETAPGVLDLTRLSVDELDTLIEAAERQQALKLPSPPSNRNNDASGPAIAAGHVAATQLPPLAGQPDAVPTPTNTQPATGISIVSAREGGQDAENVDK